MKDKKAVALAYNAQNDSAPRVVAKGKNELALKIIAKAQEFDVPLFILFGTGTSVALRHL